MKKVYGFLVLAVMLLCGMTAKAQCTDYTPVPYTTGFEGIATGSLPACWSQIQTGTSGSGTFPCVYEYAPNTRTGNCYFEFEASSSSSTFMEVVALPMMQDINTLMLNMWVSSSSSYPCSLEVGVLEDDSTFTTVETISLITFSGSSGWKQNYHEYSVLFNNYTGYGERIAIRAVRIGTGQFTLFVDDLTVMTAPSCMHPLSVSASNVTSYTADLTINGIAPAFRVYYTAGNTTDSVDIYDTTYTLTGLTASTTYNVNVVSLCDDGTITTGVTTTFRTPCDAGGCDVVINMNDSYGDGWNGHAINGFANGSQVFTATITNGHNDSLVYSQCSTDILVLTWTSGNYASEVSFNITVGGDTLLSGSGMDYSNGSNVATINGCPSCPAPSDVVVDTVLPTEITIHWTPGDVETEWNIYVNDSIIENVNTNPYTVTGLDQYTWYTLAVSAACPDSGNSLVSSAVTARTTFTCPWPENLTATVTGGDTVMVTWNSGSSTSVGYYLVYGASGFNPASIDPSDYIVVSDSSFEITGLTAGLYQVYVRSDCGSDGYSTWAGPASFGIGYMNINQADTLHTCGVIICDDGGQNGDYTSNRDDVVVVYPTDPSTYGLLVSGHSQTEGSWDYLTIYEGVGTSGTVLFCDNNSGVYDDLTVGPFNVEGPVTIAFHSDGSVYYPGFEIGITCYELPACARPNNLIFSSINVNDATINFSGNSSSYRVYWSDGTTVDSTDITDTVYTINGLTPSTNYTVTVVSICSDGSLSMSISNTFRTACIDGGCQMLFTMTGDYFDSWEYSGITGYVNGVNTFTATMPGYATSGTYTFDICNSDTLVLNWMSGMYDEECDFVITVGGSILASGNGGDYTNGGLIATTNGCPSCATPTAFNATNISTNGANITWLAGGSETEWEVTVGDSVFYTSTNNAVVSGLDANTYYNVSIRSICDVEDTSNALTAGFRTSCDLMSIPFSEDFESYSYGNTPACWDVVTGDAYVSNGYPHSGSNYLHFSGGSPNVIALPAMSQPTGTLQVRFWTRPEIFTSSSCGNFEVGYMTNLNVDSTFVMVASWPYNSFSAYEEKEVPMVGAPDSARIVLRQTNNDTYYYWYVDDLVVEPMPACPRPSNLVATTVTDNQIDVNFAGSTSGNYILYITDGASYSDSVNVTADSTHSFTGLTQLTTYTITVVADCGTEVSPSRSITVSTTMVADLLPINTGFEVGQDTNWMIVNGSQANQWYIGSATNNGGSRALYISNNNGVSNSYDESSTSNVFATKLVNFDSIGDYAVSYDWRANAESCCDYLRVFLAPGNAEFTAGSMGSISSSGAPTGWISLDGGNKLNGASTWQNYNEVFSIGTVGNYNLVFFWHNDGSVGTNPPAAIDNVQLTRLSCPQPQNITVDAVTDASATLHWTPAGSETEWAVTCNGVTSIVSTASTTVTGLEAAHSYTFVVRAVCGMGDTSFASTANFVTDMCGSAVTVENWDSTMNATTSSYSPVGYSLYNYSYVQTIIPASRMDANGTEITAMAFLTASASAGSYFTNMDVYLANVSEDDLSTAFIMPDSNHQFVHVIANADFSYSTADWQLHAFDTAFTWDGTSNVLVAVNRRHGSWTSGSSFAAHEDTVERTRYDYRDSGPYSINTIDPTDGDPDYDVGDIRLISCGAGCPAPVISNLTHDYGSATVTVAGNNIGYELTYGTDPSNLGNAMTSTDGNFTITGLTPATQYFIAVTQLCDSGAVSGPALRNFTTDSLPCFEPTGLAVVNTAFNSAELSWTSTGNATSWVVSIAGAGATRYDTVSTNPYTVTGLYA
ncbi:MAG: fibronectin type III domain-containing protein, partial [Bacteroidales bacterium]|nr:fibronectin type III domain-containing protein [Bacteroidales bacterium]